MRSGIRAIGPALLAAALLVGFSGVARAGGEAGGDITFRLILRGDVIDGDAFTLGVNELAEPPTIISPGVRCGPGSEAYNPQFVACEPGTYEVVLQGSTSLPTGTELEYAWARNYGGEANPQADIIYRDTITVTENAQVFTVVYDYRGGAQLPNTAMPTSADGVPFGILAVIVAVLGGTGVCAVETAAANLSHKTNRCPTARDATVTRRNTR